MNARAGAPRFADSERRHTGTAAIVPISSKWGIPLIYRELQKQEMPNSSYLGAIVQRSPRYLNGGAGRQ